MYHKYNGLFAALHICALFLVQTPRVYWMLFILLTKFFFICFFFSSFHSQYVLIWMCSNINMKKKARWELFENLLSQLWACAHFLSHWTNTKTSIKIENSFLRVRSFFYGMSEILVCASCIWVVLWRKKPNLPVIFSFDVFFLAHRRPWSINIFFPF